MYKYEQELSKQEKLLRHSVELVTWLVAPESSSDRERPAAFTITKGHGHIQYSC